MKKNNQCFFFITVQRILYQGMKLNFYVLKKLVILNKMQNEDQEKISFHATPSILYNNFLVFLISTFISACK